MRPAAGRGAQGTYNAGLTSLLADAVRGEAADNVALDQCEQDRNRGQAAHLLNLSAHMTALRTCLREGRAAGGSVVVGFGEPAEFLVGMRGRAPHLDTAAVTGVSVRADQHV
jgi:hypothetical protein